MQEQSGVWKSQIIYIGLLENWSVVLIVLV